MKRIMVFWLVLLLPIFVLAKEYTISDINIKLDVNEDYIVLTRDNLNNNPDLIKLNVTEEYMKTVMENNNIYLDIIKNDLSYEILVVVPKTTPLFNNLSEATDEELSTLKNIIIKETGDNMPIVYKNDYSYITVNYHDSNGYYNMNYYTVFNSRGYNIQLQKKTAITDSDKSDLNEIVDSITFIKESDNKEPFNYKIIILGVVLGLIAGIITYIIGTKIIKKKSSK